MSAPTDDPTDDLDLDYEADDYQDWPGQRTHAYCDRYEQHDPHTYRAVDGNTYRCPGATADDVAEWDRLMESPCEHGLSASLCAGPDHYPPDL